jgi:hypothetical protein
MTRALEWLAATRDHPDRPDRVQCHVLTMLALRLDWDGRGRGFASVPELMADADASKSTVERALGWARGKGPARDSRFFLVQTKRGHRLGNGKTKASEWLLRLPGDPPYVPPPRKAGASQGVTRDTLRSGLKVSGGASQGVTRDTPPRPSTPRPSPVADVSHSGTGSSRGFVADVDQSTTGSRAELIKIVHDELARRDPPLYLGDEWAAKTVDQIPEYVRPAKRAAYLRKMIQDEPNPRTRFGEHPYPDRYVAPPPLPPWRPP